MTSFTPSTPLDLSQMTNDELEDLVANLGSGSAKPAASGINWDDALFDTFNDDFTLADPSAFTLPTFPLSQQTAGTAYPTSYLPGPASAGAPQFISPGLLGGSSVPPSLVGGLLPPAPPVAAATASAGGHGSSVYSHGGSTYTSSDDTRYEAASVLSTTLSQSRSQRHQSFSIAPPTNATPATASAAVQQPKKAASSVGGGSDGGVPQRYKRTKTGCLCCRQRRVRCCETKPDCKRCRNAGRECVWPSAENPSSTRKLPGGEVTLPSGTVVGARKKGSIAGSVGGGSKRSERGAGSAANEKKAETKRTSVAAAAAAFAAADIQEHEQLPERTQSASPPTSSSASPVPAGFKQQLAQQPAKHKQHRSPSSVCSSALSPCPSASDGESTTPPPPGASLVDSAVAATIERAQSMEIDGSVSPMSNVLPQMPPSFSGSAVGGTDQWLLPWFPTAEARGLILHFCQNSGALLMANPPTVSPLLATLLPLSLSRPRGSNAAVDGLRTTLLTIAATHQAYLLAKARAPQDIVGRALDLAVGFRAEARALLAAADAADVGTEHQGRLPEDVLVRLAGAVMGSTVDVMLGGHGFSKNLDTALALVRSCGGPDVLLQQRQAGSIALDDTGKLAVDPVRLLLEILAGHEVFAGLVTGTEARLVNEGTWWSATGQVSYHRESVENHFGTTRAVISLVARANSLMLRASQASGAIPEISTASNNAADCLFHEDGLSLAFLRDVTGLSGCSTPTVSASTVGGNEPDVLRISKDVGQLFRDVERELGNARALVTGRTKDGSEAYLRAVEVLVYRHIYHVGRTDIRVQAASLAVLESCSSAINIIRPTHLMWPMLISSTQVDMAARPWITSLFDGLRTQCCFNVDSAEKIVRAVWTRLDRGEEWANWKSAVVDLDMKVLLT